MLDLRRRALGARAAAGVTLCDEFRFRSLTPDTAVYGVVGRPIGHSLSPAMHNAAFAAEGLDAVYLPLEAADADDAFTFAEAIDLRRERDRAFKMSCATTSRWTTRRGRSAR